MVSSSSSSSLLLLVLSSSLHGGEGGPWASIMCASIFMCITLLHFDCDFGTFREASLEGSARFSPRDRSESDLHYTRAMSQEEKTGLPHHDVADKKSGHARPESSEHQGGKRQHASNPLMMPAARGQWAGRWEQ